ncbi:YolD-like family protein [Paenibacillus antarcticus]|uniref:YolD-like family protein n=1 Tax=Paenibacillus antarcticus TaxID=253703 RepID=A0A168R0X0_9BACL|nr:YolD-like family protein [Paenibacillus antarcticus]OAB48448.1 hypothetical protein PBAT_02110 [Paenibacillus antarcticus]
MSKKLQGNGVYESSRFIIPQHKEAAIRQAQEVHRRKKPSLDEQQWEMVEQALSESIREHVPIAIHVFGAFENREVTGMVTRVDTYRKQVKLSFEDDYEWIKYEDIIAAEA